MTKHVSLMLHTINRNSLGGEIRVCNISWNKWTYRGFQQVRRQQIRDFGGIKRTLYDEVSHLQKLSMEQSPVHCITPRDHTFNSCKYLAENSPSDLRW